MVRIDFVLCELKIKYKPDLEKLVSALTENGYSCRISPVFKEFPQTGIDHYAVRIGEERSNAKEN